MLLTISTDHAPATDLGFLLHKRPDRFQSFDLSFGRAHVFYLEANEHRCTAALMLDVDPVAMVRKRRRQHDFRLGHYVNDRPYVASSFMSNALAQVYGTAMAGRCKDRPELVNQPLSLTARIDVLPVKGGQSMLSELFEPLGYQVEAIRHPLDDRFPEWGPSPYYSVTIAGTTTLAEMLSHLYVLIPVFDNQKHYFVGEDELEKLLAKGATWLPNHPAKEQITRRYLKFRSSLYRQALVRLADEEIADFGSTSEQDLQEGELERPISLNQQRHQAVVSVLRESKAKSVLDLGCGEGKLLRELVRDQQFDKIVGVDVSIRSLELAHKRLKLDRVPDSLARRIGLLHGSLIYRDQRFQGFDAAAMVEVIEHLDPARLAAMERVVFGHARPKTIVITTPNREYNVMWENLPAGKLRHNDHRFEWTRQEFQTWAQAVADRFGYAPRFLPVGPEALDVGAPTQMGVFERG